MRKVASPSRPEPEQPGPRTNQTDDQTWTKKPEVPKANMNHLPLVSPTSSGSRASSSSGGGGGYGSSSAAHGSNNNRAAAAHAQHQQPHPHPPPPPPYDGSASVSSAATGSTAATAAELLHGQGPIVYDNLRSGHFGGAAAAAGGGVAYSNLSSPLPQQQQQQQQQEVNRQNAQRQHQVHMQHYGGGSNGRHHHQQRRLEDDGDGDGDDGGDDDDDAFVNITEDGILEGGQEEDETGIGGEEMLYYQNGGHDDFHLHPHSGGGWGGDGMAPGGGTAAGGKVGGDVLALLLSGPPSRPSDEEDDVEEEKEREAGGGRGSRQPNDLATICEEAGRAARRAAALLTAAAIASPSSRDSGAQFKEAAARHAESAAKYREAAVLIGSDDAALSRSLLLLSLAQARSASNVMARHKGIICPHAADAEEETPSGGGGGGGGGGNSHASYDKGVTASTSFGNASARASKGGSDGGDGSSSRGGGRPRSNSQVEQQERLRAKIRGAMDSGSKKEADMTDSMFLVGTGTSSKQAASPPRSDAASAGTHDSDATSATGTSQNDNTSEGISDTNPVDDIMKLENELKAMDFATLEMGSSVASIGTRMTSARSVKTNMDAEGSFCVVPGSASYMSSSVMRTSRIIPSRPRHENRTSELPPPGTVPGGRAVKPNHVQAANVAAPPLAAAQSTGLESSWWGHPAGASHIMSASISSVGGRPLQNGSHQQDNVASTKELMRLLDTVKALGDENVALMREVEEAQAARHEAMVAKEQMKRFKEEYSRRFTTLKAALDKFRKEYAENPSQQTKMKNHQLLHSDFAKTTSLLESQKKDQLIRQLAAELKKEKDESKKKDAALRKYETFYREVKARSAQKAKQREQEQQRLAQQKKAIDRTTR